MSLADNPGSAYHGAVYALPSVTAGQSTKYTNLLSVAGGAGELGAQPLTVESTNPIMAAGPSDALTAPGGFFDDSVRLDAKLCVQWSRGPATFYAECDLGCSMVVLATTVNVGVAVYFNPLGPAARTTNVAVTRGAHPRPGALAGPVWTSGALAAGGSSGGSVRVPPFARAFRVGSSSRSLVQVWNYKRSASFGAGGTNVLQNGPTLVRSFSEVHPIDTNADYLQIVSAGYWMGLAETYNVKFLLDL